MPAAGRQARSTDLAAACSLACARMVFKAVSICWKTGTEWVYIGLVMGCSGKWEGGARHHFAVPSVPKAASHCNPHLFAAPHGVECGALVQFSTPDQMRASGHLRCGGMGAWFLNQIGLKRLPSKRKQLSKNYCVDRLRSAPAAAFQPPASALAMRVFASSTPRTCTCWRASTTKPLRLKNGSAQRLTSAHNRAMPACCAA